MREPVQPTTDRFPGSLANPPASRQTDRPVDHLPNPQTDRAPDGCSTALLPLFSVLFPLPSSCSVIRHYTRYLPSLFYTSPSISFHLSLRPFGTFNCHVSVTAGTGRCLGAPAVTGSFAEVRCTSVTTFLAGRTSGHQPQPADPPASEQQGAAQNTGLRYL